MKILTSIVAVVAMAFGSVAYATDCHVNAAAVVADYSYAAPVVVQPLVAVPLYSAVAVSDYQPVAYRNIVEKNVIRVEQPARVQKVVVRERRQRVQRVQRVQKVVEVQKVEVQKVVKVQKVQRVRAVHGHAIQQLNAGY